MRPNESLTDIASRPWVKHILLLAAGIALVGLYIYRTNPRRVLTEASSLPMSVVLMAGGLLLLVWFFRVWSLHQLGKGVDPPVKPYHSLSGVMGSNVLNLLLPARLGDVNLLMYFARGRDLSQASALVLHWRFQSLGAGLGLAAVVGALFLAPDMPGAYLLASGGYVVALGLVAAVITVAVRWMGIPQDSLRERFQGAPLVDRLLDPTLRLVSDGRFLFRLRFFVPAVVLAGVAWVLTGLVGAAIVRTILPATPPLVAYGAPIVGALSGIIRLTPGGFGIYEGGFAAYLIGFGADPAGAVAAATVTHGLSTVLLLLVGALPAYQISERVATSSTTEYHWPTPQSDS